MRYPWEAVLRLSLERRCIFPKTGAFLVEKYGTHVVAFPKDSLGSDTTKYDETRRRIKEVSMSVATITPLPLRFPAARKQKMACPEWCVFVEKYAQATRIFSEAAVALPSSPGSGFNHAWERAERARKMCDEARTALLRHEHNHDCASARASW
jgi:hypothetical protein